MERRKIWEDQNNNSPIPRQNKWREMAENERQSMLTKKEAALRAGISVRSLERYASQGRITVGYRQARKGKEAVFDAEELDRLKRDLAAPAAVVSPPPRHDVANNGGPPALRPRPEGGELAALLITRALEISILPQKMALTVAQAALVSGLSIKHLRAAIRAAKLSAFAAPHCRGLRIHREILEQYVSDLAGIASENMFQV
jgi:hypothetical protein